MLLQDDRDQGVNIKGGRKPKAEVGKGRKRKMIGSLYLYFLVKAKNMIGLLENEQRVSFSMSIRAL